MDPSHARGATSEFYAAAWWSSRGHELFWPVGSAASAIDFIAVKNGQRHRIQVKTGTPWSKDSYEYVTTNLRRPGKRVRRKQFDYLSLVSPYGWMLNVPTAHLPTRSQFHIRLDDQRTPKQENWRTWMTTLSH